MIRGSQTTLMLAGDIVVFAATTAGGIGGSEFRGWLSGRGLARFMQSPWFPKTYRKNLFSFSQRATVCGAALTTHGLQVENYVMTQAAIPAGCFDPRPEMNDYQRFADKEAIDPTPDAAADLGYRAYLTGLNVTGQVVSFYNVEDYALKTGTVVGIPVANWEANQILFKPDSFGDTEYEFNPSLPEGQRCRVFLDLGLPNNPGRTLTDIRESVAFVARPRSEAAGATAEQIQGFGSSYDVGRNSPTGLKEVEADHSGQFNRPFYRLRHYYRELGTRLNMFGTPQ